MESVKRNRQLFLDKEFVATLALAKEGILYPVERLMNKAEAKEVEETGHFHGKPFPFPFIIAPSGEKNKEILTTAYQGEPLDFIVDGKIKGTIIVDEVFEVDRHKRIGVGQREKRKGFILRACIVEDQRIGMFLKIGFDENRKF